MVAIQIFEFFAYFLLGISFLVKYVHAMLDLWVYIWLRGHQAGAIVILSCGNLHAVEAADDAVQRVEFFVISTDISCLHNNIIYYHNWRNSQTISSILILCSSKALIWACRSLTERVWRPSYLTKASFCLRLILFIYCCLISKLTFFSKV